MSGSSLDLTDADFEAKVLQASTPILVDFWAEWCAPCRTLSPVIEKIATQFSGKVMVAKMNIDQHPITPGKYNVRAIPTLLLFKQGQLVDQLVGLVSEDKLSDFLNQHIEAIEG